MELNEIPKSLYIFCSICQFNSSSEGNFKIKNLKLEKNEKSNIINVILWRKNLDYFDPSASYNLTINALKKLTQTLHKQSYHLKYVSLYDITASPND